MIDDPEIPYEPKAIGAVGATVILLSLIFGTYLGRELFARLVALVQHLSLLDAREFVDERPIFGALSQLAAGGAILAIARHVYHPGGRFTRAYGLRPVNTSKILLAALVGFALQFPFAELHNFVEGVAPLAFEQKARIARILAPESFGEGISLVLSVVAIAPVVEELVFRGLLLPGIARGSGVVVGVAISTLGFALSHALPAPVAVAFAGGLVLSAITYRTGSLLPSIAMHAAHNALPVLLPFRVLAVPGWNVLSPEPTHVSTAVYLPSLGVAAVALYFLLRDESPEA